MNWDQYFMSMTYFVAMRSKDKRTHIGAVIVDDKHRIISCGYNSFPRGIDDSLQERQTSPEKFNWMVHAEVNAILLAKCDLSGSIMYTQGIPCMGCARSIVQAEIKEVVVHKQWDDTNYGQWIEQAEKTKQLFKEAGVNLRYYDGDFVREISGLREEKKI